MSARNGRIASSTQKDTWLWAYAALGAVLAFGYAAVTRKVTSPYMDEPFHVPQAQRYCRGDFWTWDPKLTTPPGLYLFAAGLVQLLQLVAPLFGLQTKGLGDVVCSLASLRAWNLLFSIGTFWTIHSILLELRRQRQAAAQKADKKLENGVQASNSYLEAFAIILFPVSFFFHFLYYTDSGSTLFVLLAYLWMLERRYWKSAIAAFISLWFRQTNVVWAVFVAGLAVANSLGENRGLEALKERGATPGSFIRAIIALVQGVVSNPSLVVATLFPYLLPLGSFAAFLIWNGGTIVLGDKSNHVASLHFPQLFYFAGFSTAFMLPILPIAALAKRIKYLFTPLSTLFLAIAAAIQAFLIQRYTIEHPFLLSDNRHYTFYLWKNVYRRHFLVRYLLIPVYTACMWIIGQLLSSTVTAIWMLGFYAAIIITLVPSPLLEFRYFIIPFLLLRLHMPAATRTQISLELIFNGSINLATIIIFLTKTFRWSSEPENVQRFMW